MIKKYIFSFLSLILCSNISFSQTPCENGMAGQFPCKNIDILANIPVATMANSMLNPNGTGPEGSDIWGWTDPTTNKEYALVCTTNSTAFVDISDPINPIYLGKLDTNKGANFWRDVKVYQNHAFIVADKVGAHGMQVFDLTKLRNVSNPPVNFSADAIYNTDNLGSCHNIVINEDKGVAYLVGCEQPNGARIFNGGPIFVDISDPKNPTKINHYAAEGYSHDAQVVTYDGPDTDYTGKEIYIGSNETKISILDVTDKNNIKKIADITYDQLGYTHQGWFTEDKKFFLLGDELDEKNIGTNTRTLIFDFTDLDNPKLSSTYLGASNAIDHNGYVKGNEFYLASYRAGLRIFDIQNIAASSNSMTEIAFLDTYPDNDGAAFNGVWSVYPYFASGNIVINDIEKGLFIVRKSGSLSTENNTIDKSTFTIFPNPSANTPTIITSNNKLIQSVDVFNILGKRIYTKQNINSNRFVVPVQENAKGLYILKINNQISKKLILK